MIDPIAASEIISTYRKYGWILRRLLISGTGRKRLLGKMPDATEVPVTLSEIDAAWFSRPPKDGPVAWEIRYLGDIPFALLENLDENDIDFEASLREIEARLHEVITAKRAP